VEQNRKAGRNPPLVVAPTEEEEKNVTVIGKCLKYSETGNAVDGKSQFILTVIRNPKYILLTT